MSKYLFSFLFLLVGFGCKTGQEPNGGGAGGGDTSGGHPPSSSAHGWNFHNPNGSSSSSAAINVDTCNRVSEANCPHELGKNGRRCVFLPPPGPQLKGSCAESIAAKCSEYTVVECQNSTTQLGKRCDVFIDEHNNSSCGDERKETCAAYAPVECTDAKPWKVYPNKCALNALGFCDNAPLPHCKDYLLDQCHGATTTGGTVCEVVGKKCQDKAGASRQANCSGYTDQPACDSQKTISGQDCQWNPSPSPGSCADKVVASTNCSDYPPASCVVGAKARGKTCNIVASGRCGDPPQVPYYRKADGTPLIRNPVYDRPVDLGVSNTIHCLDNKPSRFFKNDDDVNQFFVDLADVRDQPFYLYRWEQRKYAAQKAKHGPTEAKPGAPSLSERSCLIPPGFTTRPMFQPLQPDNTGERNSTPRRNLGAPCAANGVGAAYYGRGLYMAFTPFASITYGFDTIRDYGVDQLYAMQSRVEAGTLMLDSNNRHVRDEMSAVGLTDDDVYRCNPPLTFVVAGTGWVVVKDPIGFDDTDEFNGEEFPKGTPARATLKRKLKRYLIRSRRRGPRTEGARLSHISSKEPRYP